jgi:hypothetical protein
VTPSDTAAINDISRKPPLSRADDMTGGLDLSLVSVVGYSNIHGIW